MTPHINIMVASAGGGVTKCSGMIIRGGLHLGTCTLVSVFLLEGVPGGLNTETSTLL